MGWRAIRLALDRPVLLRMQLRALLRAAAGRRLHVMFPMIAEASEFVAARAVLDKEAARMQRLKQPLTVEIKAGTMLEVPSLAFQLPALLKLVDFVSIGSNDLMQFLFASDRGSPRLANRYDLLSPAALTALRSIVRACDEARVPVSLCGEAAGRPLEAMALVGLGLRSLSMTSVAVGPVKAMLRRLDARSLARRIDGWCERPDRTLRHELLAFAQANGVPV
jgi:phosphotransferase system enzyme I (PtsP)